MKIIPILARGNRTLKRYIVYKNKKPNDFAKSSKCGDFFVCLFVYSTSQREGQKKTDRES